MWYFRRSVLHVINRALKIDIKPLSVNEAWKGRRFKSPKYKAFIIETMYKLKPLTVPAGPLMLNITFGFSSKLSDVDNPLKMVIDTIGKKYGFDDRRFYRLNVSKIIVPKGSDFFEFKILPFLGSCDTLEESDFVKELENLLFTNTNVPVEDLRDIANRVESLIQSHQ